MTDLLGQSTSLAQQTLDALRNHGWIKHKRGNNATGFCLVGAAEYLCKRHYLGIGTTPCECAGLKRRILRVVLAEYPNRTGGRASPLVSFNDYPFTTWTDVERVLEKVIASEVEYGPA